MRLVLFISFSLLTISGCASPPRPMVDCYAVDETPYWLCRDARK
jgi:hypothetical protein